MNAHLRHGGRPGRQPHQNQPHQQQRGVSLIVVLILLVIVSLLGVGAAQIAGMGERSARNDRDMQVAWQSAEAALMDAQCDIDPNNSGNSSATPCVGSRVSTFANATNTNAFTSPCTAGLCALATTGKPAWLTADLNNPSSTTTAAFGDFTSRTYQTGLGGVSPAAKPRYIIEPIEDPQNRDLSGASTSYIYRITALGYGPRTDIQAVSQIIYRD